MGTRLPSISGRRAVRAFERIGFDVMPKRGKGSHFFLRRATDGRKLTVPNHDPLKPGTLRSLIRHAGVTVDQFVELL